MDVAHADDAVSALRIATDEHEGSLKAARGALEAIRSLVAELDVARATAESDLAHLATSCLDTVQATLDEVRAEVDELEQAGELTPDARVICAEEPEETDDADEQVRLSRIPRRGSTGQGRQDQSCPGSASPALEAAAAGPQRRGSHHRRFARRSIGWAP